MQTKAAKKKTQSLRIIIVGCGKVGHTLTEQLVREGHDVTIVDTSERVVRDTTDAFDVMGIQGNGAETDGGGLGMTLAPGYGYAAKALQRLHRKLNITVVDGVQQMIFQRVAVLQHLDAEDGLFRQQTLPW